MGDALGVPFEFRSPDSIRTEDVRMVGGGIHGQLAGTWSDDGAMTLALLDSLQSAGFDPADQARRYLAWAEHGTYTPDDDGLFDIGGTTAQAFARLHDGAPAESAGGIDERSNGNGSLMRTLPIALVGRELDKATLIDQTHRASAVTHRHPLSQITCAAYVLIAVQLLGGRTERSGLADEALADLGVHYERTGRRDHLAALGTLADWPAREGRGYVIDSFWSAWEAFMTGSDYRDAVTSAILYGNDTDTTGCIAGGLAGVYFGLESIPSEWLEVMRGRAIVERVLRRGLRPAILVNCPHCGRRIRPRLAVLGFPTLETMEAAERGDVVLLGCIVTGADPTHVCPACGAGLVRTGGRSYRLLLPPPGWAIAPLDA